MRRKKDPKIFYVKRLPGKFAGVTLPPLGIFIEEGYKNNERIFEHELCHWRQFQEGGILKTYLRYLFLWFKYGYQNHPLEIECRKKTEKI